MGKFFSFSLLFSFDNMVNDKIMLVYLLPPDP